MSRSESDVKQCSLAIVLPALLFGIPLSTTALNFGASFLGYGVMLALGIAPNPAAAPPSYSTSAPMHSTSAPNIASPFLNGTNTPPTLDLSTLRQPAAQSTSERHPICGLPDLNVTSAMEFATMTAFGTAIAFSVWSIIVTIGVWYYSDNAKETAETARVQTYGALGANFFVGPVAAGLYGFSRYCMPILSAAKMMGAPFFGLIVLGMLALLGGVAYSCGKRCARKEEVAEASTAARNPTDAHEITPVQVISQAATPRSSRSLELQQRNSLRLSRVSGSGTFNASPAASSPKSRSPHQGASIDDADTPPQVLFERRFPTVFTQLPGCPENPDTNGLDDGAMVECTSQAQSLKPEHARKPTQEFKSPR